MFYFPLLELKKKNEELKDEEATAQENSKIHDSIAYDEYYIEDQ